jgi:hypothetical protein
MAKPCQYCGNTQDHCETTHEANDCADNRTSEPVIDGAATAHIKNKGVCETLSEVHPAALVRALAAEVVSLRDSLTQAREEGRREGMRDAAKMLRVSAKTTSSTIQHDVLMQLHDVITRAAEAK